MTDYTRWQAQKITTAAQDLWDHICIRRDVSPLCGSTHEELNRAKRIINDILKFHTSEKAE